MNVTIVTPCRDATHQLAAYRERIEALDWPHNALRVVIVEGDSVDHTRNMLASWLISWHDDIGLTLVTRNTGKPRYGSVVNAERFQILATVFNAGLDQVDQTWSDYVLFLPVDIRYSPDLLKRLTGWGKDVISPFVFQNGVFYDIWALSIDGRFVGPFPESDVTETMPVEATTIGGTMLSRIEVLRAGVRYGLAEVDRDYSRAARAAGFRLWADPTTKVYHGNA